MRRYDALRLYGGRVKGLVSPEQALQRYVPGFRSSKGFAMCLFHREDTASLKILPDHVYCYGCHFHADVIGLVAALLDLPPFEALERLNADFRLGLPIKGHVPLNDASKFKEDVAGQRSAEQEEKERRVRREAVRNRIILRLFAVQRLITWPNPADPLDTDDPHAVLWRWAIREEERLNYLLDYDLYDEE